MKKFKSTKLSIAAISAIIAVLSCSSDIELPPSYDGSSSSTVPSDGSSSSVVHGGGSSSEVASSSSEAESSSGTVPSSSSVEPSSSSVLPSSSGTVPSSSSVEPSSSSILPSSSSVVHSSSSVLPSSSSVLPSSSSVVPSSSSVVPCTASENTETHYCSVGTLKAYGSLFDSRNDKTYKTVVIGNQTWMAENLNYKTPDGSSRCYPISGTTNTSDEDNANCDKYGRLYNWNTAMNNSASSTANPSGVQGICPNGWHLPSRTEWNVLGNDTKKLKATSSWNNLWNGNSGNGTDDYGFSALPGGGGYSYGSFFSVDDNGSWWSTEDDASDAYTLDMLYDRSYAIWSKYGKSLLYSVRCVKDGP